MNPTRPEFSEVITSRLDLDDCAGPATLAELVFRPTAREGTEEDDTQPILLGTVGEGALTVTLRSLRHAMIVLSERFAVLGLRSGDCVCVARLPRTSESLAAVVYGALAVAGIRVFFPMYLDAAGFADWLLATETKAVFWAASEGRRGRRSEGDLALLSKLEGVARRAGVAAYCFDKDLGMAELLKAPSSRYDFGCPAVQRLIASSCAEDVTLILTTSGSSGRAKLVRYRQRAILASCRAWAVAGMFAPEKLGGRCLCLLLAHSMGLRAFWNALWTRQPLCLIPPEWFLEHPDRARALLLEMKAEHITGGPAAFHTVLELSRVYPDLKDVCFQHLRCGVSSGAAFTPGLSGRVKDALGLRLENGFGMTETMQAMSTLTAGTLSQAAGMMGNPLPGVEIGLEAGGSGAFRLWLRSPFSFDGYVDAGDEKGFAGKLEDGWFSTGDLVECSDGGLRYAGRESDDFLKDGFGVKVQLAAVAERYRALDEAIVHLEFFPLNEEPGLAALIFIKASVAGADGEPQHDADFRRRLERRIRGAIESRHESLLGVLDDFELRHFTIARFAWVAAEPPLTAKGTVSRQRVEREYGDVIARLKGRSVKTAGVVELKRERLMQRAGSRLTSPRRGEMLELANLDKDYVHAQGDHLYYDREGERTRVLDLVGGFGMNLLGHRHEALMDAVRDFAAGGRPWMGDQGSARPQEGELARRLVDAVSETTGQSYVVRFGSTGAEAVEIALAHAFLERRERWEKFKRSQQRAFGSRAPVLLAKVLETGEEMFTNSIPQVIAFEGGFHGNSLGARSLRGGEKSILYRPMTRLVRLELPLSGDSDIESLLAECEMRLPALAEVEGKVVESEVRISSIIAAIYEPVIGEGGVREPPMETVRQLENRVFPLIADEIQCGLGRCGTFLASEGVHADYYLFAKALGGGIAKISAAMVERSRYVERFDEHYSTTFSGDGFSCAVAGATLELIEREQVPLRAAERGAEIKRRLQRIAAEHPEVISEVTGRGLMLGIHFRPSLGERMVSFRLLARHKLMGIAIASYLLNRHNLRLLPTLSATNTLRVAPSIYIADSDIEQLERGLRSFCRAAECGDSAQLLDCLVEEELHLPGAQYGEAGVPRFSCAIEAPAPGAKRVAFLGHFVSPERDIAMLEPVLGELSRSARRTLLQKVSAITEMKPTPLMARNLFGGRVWFYFILIGADTASIEEMNRSGKRDLFIRRIQDGVELAAEQGCEILTLGAHTSIVSRDGLELHAPPGMQLTTGNSLTVAVAVNRILRACAESASQGDRHRSIAIIGATGNIGSALARHLFSQRQPFERVLLVARNRSRLQALAAALAAIDSGLEIAIATDLAGVRDADFIAITTSTNEPLLYPHHIRARGRVVVADISAPEAVSPLARSLENVRVIPLAGAVDLPGEPDFVMGSMLPEGTAFCCAAEAMLLGVAPPQMVASLDLLGAVKAENVDVLAKLAEEHHFLAAAEEDLRRLEVAV
jgi:acetylornithine/succinyldiaminopimelate/putrescine aminotransferase/predicted amino acid dehydrogenase/long-subunit acyl-CoA synthetase (AMP-forming)